MIKKKNELLNIANNEESPIYVFDILDLKQRILKIQNALGDKVELCFSMKANPFVLGEIIDDVDKIEVCSPGELDICNALGKSINKSFVSKIVYSGLSKTYENIKDAVESEVGEYTAESIDQVIRLNEIAREKQKVLPVLLRLNAGSQFGMSEEDIEYVVKKRDMEFDNIDIQGLHYFVGTQRKCKELSKQKKDIERLETFCKRIEDEFGFRFIKIEYGPGLPVGLYCGDEQDEDVLALQKLKQIMQNLIDNFQVTIEMGRYLSTYCGYYMTRLMEKKTCDDVNYAILDGGINHINYYGQVMGMYTPIVIHVDKAGNIIENGSQEWRMCGSLCTVNDYLMKSYLCDSMNVGDLFIFCNVGAYSMTESMFLFLSRKLPKIILLKEDGNYVVVREGIESSQINIPQYTM